MAGPGVPGGMMSECKECGCEIDTIKDHAPGCVRTALALKLAEHYLSGTSAFRDLAKKKKEEEHG
jgi:hypothetical protein